MMEFSEKQRIIQEFVPGKQVTLAHLIANPQEILYKKLGAVTEKRGALGVLTITPSEGTIIAGRCHEDGKCGVGICRPLFRLTGDLWRGYKRGDRATCGAECTV